MNKNEIEIWKPVILLDIGESYEGLYEVSNLGRVRSLHRKEIIVMAQQISCNGYYRVQLWKDGAMKYCRVHRLVGFAFLADSYFEGAVIDHVNTIKTDNRAENLRWVTQKENLNNPLNMGKRKKIVDTALNDINTPICYYNKNIYMRKYIERW